jgi:hypothetical protein
MNYFAFRLHQSLRPITRPNDPNQHRVQMFLMKMKCGIDAIEWKRTFGTGVFRFPTFLHMAPPAKCLRESCISRTSAGRSSLRMPLPFGCWITGDARTLLSSRAVPGRARLCNGLRASRRTGGSGPDTPMILSHHRSLSAMLLHSPGSRLTRQENTVPLLRRSTVIPRPLPRLRDRVRCQSSLSF